MVIGKKESRESNPLSCRKVKKHQRANGNRKMVSEKRWCWSNHWQRARVRMMVQSNTVRWTHGSHEGATPTEGSGKDEIKHKWHTRTPMSNLLRVIQPGQMRTPCFFVCMLRVNGVLQGQWVRVARARNLEHQLLKPSTLPNRVRAEEVKAYSIAS